eukprot:2650056-Amphidinium_carterae.1
MYQGKVAELQSQVHQFQKRFGQRVRKTVEQEVKHKSEQIAKLQNQIRHGGNSFEVAQLQKQLAVENAKLKQLTWMKEQRAQDVREACDTILQ